MIQSKTYDLRLKTKFKSISNLMYSINPLDENIYYTPWSSSVPTSVLIFLAATLNNCNSFIYRDKESLIVGISFAITPLYTVQL